MTSRKGAVAEMDEADDTPGRTLISFGRGLLAEVAEAIRGTGLSAGEWIRACVRRELARIAAGKTKKGGKR